MAIKQEWINEELQRLSWKRRKLLIQIRAEIRGIFSSEADNVQYLKGRLANWEKRITQLEDNK